MNQQHIRLERSAARLLRRHGMLVTFIRKEYAGYDAASGKREAPVTRQWQAWAVKSGVSEEFLHGGEGGTAIRSGDMMLVAECPALADGAKARPRAGDSVLFPDGRAWTVVRDMPVEPAGDALLYKGIIRK